MRNEYIEDLKYIQYMFEMTAEEEKLRGFTEMLIGEQTGANIYSIREGVTDKLSNLWAKFTGFLNRIWEKFKNYASKVIYNQVEYLEQYKDIILNRKPNDFAFEMSDYPTGIQRLTKVTIPTFKSVEANLTTEPTDTSFMRQLIPEYDEKTAWPTFAAQYFEGGSQMKSMNLQGLNMTDLYNYCHDFKTKIEPVIEKDQKTLASTYDSIKGDITKAINATKTAQQAPATNNQTPPAGNKQQTTTPPAGTNHASFIDYTYRQYFTEALDVGNGSKDSPAEPGKQGAPTSSQTAGNASVTSQNQTKIGNGSNAGVGSLQTTNDKTGKNTTNDVDTANKGEEDLKVLEEKVKNYNTAASGILTGKLQASQNMFNDYMKLIKIHVGQQVGAKGTNQAADSGTNQNQALDLSGIGVLQTFKNRAEAINSNKAPYNNPQAKAEAIKNYINLVKQKNPNFQGNFADIVKAADAAIAQQAAQKNP